MHPLGKIKDIPLEKIKLLLSEVTKVLRNEKSLLQLSTPNHGNLTVCGDVHGQFADVEHIFQHGGIPSTDNVYLFNGDLVDRGPQSLEIVLTLMAYKLLDNKSVYILRGNHETVSVNSRYGFKGEVFEMFGSDVYEDIASAFNQLPYAAVLHDDTLVVHGGPVGCNDYTNLEEIECIRRGALRNIHDSITRFTHLLFFNTVIFLIGTEPVRGSLEESLLWSDPADKSSSRGASTYRSDLSGLSRSPRGAGYVYDNFYTTTVLERNGLKNLIRSHEVVDVGCESFHDGLGYTVFSASNYCGLGNQGAFMRWSNSGDENDRGELIITRYIVPSSHVNR